MSDTAKYTILKWNGKWDKEAVFVVKNNASGKQSMFSPGRLGDLSWVKDDVAGTQCKDWEDFENEPCDNLADIVF
jgi:hypothetical protein